MEEMWSRPCGCLGKSVLGRGESKGKGPRPGAHLPQGQERDGAERGKRGRTHGVFVTSWLPQKADSGTTVGRRSIGGSWDQQLGKGKKGKWRGGEVWGRAGSWTRRKMWSRDKVSVEASAGSLGSSGDG